MPCGICSIILYLQRMKFAGTSGEAVRIQEPWKRHAGADPGDPLINPTQTSVRVSRSGKAARPQSGHSFCKSAVLEGAGMALIALRCQAWQGDVRDFLVVRHADRRHGCDCLQGGVGNAADCWCSRGAGQLRSACLARLTLGAVVQCSKACCRQWDAVGPSPLPANISQAPSEK